MEEVVIKPEFSVPPTIGSLPPAQTLVGPPPPPPPKTLGFSFPTPSIRLTSEFDSETFAFLHKISCKLFEGLAKLKFSFNNSDKGEVFNPQLSFTSRNLSIQYDIEGKNALINASCTASNHFQFRASHDVKARGGELAMVASLPDPAYKIELVSPFPAAGLPRATLRFPLGEVSVAERDGDGKEKKQFFSVNGMLKQPVLNWMCTTTFNDENLNVRCSFKDDQMTFIPRISLPSKATSFAFKRRLSLSDKLSYWYHFDTNFWGAVYKRTAGKDCKVKVGYDSDVRVGWASIWVGDENGKVKTAPMKTKLQLMLQVPQDDVSSAALLFRVKKRWDI